MQHTAKHSIPFFRLDDDAKVLTPDELLYRCVQFINQTHDKVGHYYIRNNLTITLINNS